MGGRKGSVRLTLRRTCSRRMWWAIPEELEDYIVALAESQIPPEDVDDSPFGPLFEFAAHCAWWYHSGLLDLENPSLLAQDLPWPDELPDISVATCYGAMVSIRAESLAADDFARLGGDEYRDWCRKGYTGV